MPHDKSGTPLIAGETVIVRCKVLNTQAFDEYCNVNLETVEPMYPGDYKSSLTLNSRQIEHEQ